MGQGSGSSGKGKKGSGSAAGAGGAGPAKASGGEAGMKQSEQKQVRTSWHIAAQQTAVLCCSFNLAPRAEQI